MVENDEARMGSGEVMRTFTLLLCTVALAATGCGIESEASGCDIDGLTFESNFMLDCAALSENVALARQMTGHIPVGYTVVIRGDLAWNPDAREYDVTGLWQHDPKRITLGRDGRSLAHEFLHDLDWQNGVKNTGEHPGWVTNGYGRIDEDFKKKVEAF